MAQGELILDAENECGTVRIGLYQVTLDGTPDALRPNLLRLVMAEASRLHEPVDLRIADCGHSYNLRVHPSGEVEEVAEADEAADDPWGDDSAGITPEVATHESFIETVLVEEPAPAVSPIAEQVASPASPAESAPRVLPAAEQAEVHAVAAPPAARVNLPTVVEPGMAVPGSTTGYELRFDTGTAAAAGPSRGSVSLDRPLIVLVANTKGESGKTPISVLIAEAFASVRGNDVAVVDLDPTGNLAARMGTDPAAGRLPALVDALHAASGSLQWGELSGLLAWQPTSHLWAVNARGVAKPRSGSARDAQAHISGEDLRMVIRALSAGIRVIVIDAGNNDADPAFLAAAELADQLVVPVKWDTPTVKDGAGLLLQGLYAAGFHQLATRAIIVGTYPPMRKPNRGQEARFRAEFGRLGHPMVNVAPDRHIDLRAAIEWDRLKAGTRASAIELMELICARTLPGRVPA